MRAHPRRPPRVAPRDLRMIPRRLRRPPHRLCSSHSTRRRRRNHPRPARRFGTASRGTTPELRGAPPGQRQRRPQRPPRLPSTRPRPPPELPHPADRTRRVRAQHARGGGWWVPPRARAASGAPSTISTTASVVDASASRPPSATIRSSERMDTRRFVSSITAPTCVPQRARAARPSGNAASPARPGLAPLLHCSPGRAQPTVLPRAMCRRVVAKRAVGGLERSTRSVARHAAPRRFRGEAKVKADADALIHLRRAS